MEEVRTVRSNTMTKEKESNTTDEEWNKTPQICMTRHCNCIQLQSHNSVVFGETSTFE